MYCYVHSTSEHSREEIDMRPYSTEDMTCPHLECDTALVQVEWNAWYCPSEEEIIPDSEVGR